MRHIKGSLGMFMWLALSSHSVFADIQEVTSLDFGTIVVASNNIQAQVIMDYLGSTNYVGGVYAVTSPTRAEFQLSNFPANQALFITGNSIQSNTNSDIPSSEHFTLSNVSVPNTLTTDAVGSATLYVGGTLRTSGSGSTAYTDTRYTIRYQITVNY